MIRVLRPILATALLAVLTLALTSGCTPRRKPGPVLDSPDAAWNTFRTQSCAPVKAPGLLVKASLYYTRVKPTKRTNRTLVTLWGDFGSTMRLDVAAGIGKLLAHIREDADGLLVYYPSERSAYAHTNPVLGATRLGMPFPFSLNELARVVVGDFSGLAPTEYIAARQDDAGFVFDIHGSAVTSITLGANGRPQLLAGETQAGTVAARTWQVSIDAYADTPPGATPLPEKITLSMDNGERGVLRIKSRELKIDPWPAKATGLTLPEDTIYYQLDTGQRSTGTGDIPVVYEDTP